MDWEEETAQFPNTDTAEAKAVNVLESLLKTERVKSEINTRDKLPAEDGALYLVDENNSITGKLTVQVKKLPSEHSDSPKKQFDIVALNHFVNDFAPFLLIVVDIDNEIAYWEHIDDEYMDALDFEEGQESKVIHFEREKRIDGEDESYIGHWQRMVENRREKLYFSEDYKEAYEDLRQRANPAVGQEQDFFEQIYQFLDGYNNLIQEDIPVINNQLYANARSIGLAYRKYTEEELHYGLYPIPADRNDVQIKTVDGPVLDELEETTVSRGHYDGNPIESRPTEYAKEVAYTRLENLFEQKGLIHTVDEFLAREFIFDFIDEFHLPLGLEQKDEYTLREIRYGFRNYLPFWVEEALRNKEKKGRKGNLGRRGYIDLSSLKMQTLPEERDEIDRRAQERLEADERTHPYPIGNEKLSPRIFKEFVAYLEQNGVEKIQRPYIPEDHSRYDEGGGWIWEAYSRSDIRENLERFFDKLPSVYRKIVAENFTGIQDELPLFKKASKVVITYEVKDEYESHEDSPGIQYIHLKDERWQETDPEIQLYSSEESPYHDLWGEKKVGDELIVDGTSYEISCMRTGILEFPYHELPMMNFIYDRLEDATEDYLLDPKYGI